jgi:hypothetical protein
MSDKLKELEIKKLFKEYDFLLIEDDYKKELIEINKVEFLKLYNRSMLCVLEENNNSEILSQELTQRMKSRSLWHFEEYSNPNIIDQVVIRYRRISKEIFTFIRRGDRSFMFCVKEKILIIWYFTMDFRDFGV